MPGFRFRLEDIRRLSPSEDVYCVWDDRIPGFGVRVYTSGRKSYIVRMRFRDANTGRKTERMHTLGPVYDFESVEDARQAALALRRRYRKGEDVKQTERRMEVEGTTLEQWMEMWLQQRRETGHHKPRTEKDIRRAAKDGWHGWMDRPLLSITPKRALERHAERSRTAPTRANVEARYLRALWRWVALRNPELNMVEAPTDLITRGKEWNPVRRKTRRVEMADLPAWLTAVRSLANQRAALLFQLLLFTGFRSSETRELRWSHVDFKRGTVRLVNPKNKKPITLPLSSQGLDVLHQLYELTGRSVFCFPAMSKRGVEVPMQTPTRLVAEVCEQSGVPWSPHDLRRTFLTVGGALRLHPALLRILTNHSVGGDAHSGYFTPEIDELREVSQVICDRIEAAATGAKVVKLPQRRPG